MMKYLFIIDEPEKLISYKDSTIALIKECLYQGIEAHYTNIHSLSIDKKQNIIIDSHHISSIDSLSIKTPKIKNKIQYFTKVFIRKDPPFNNSYLNLTFILEHAKNFNVDVINSPVGIRNHNEKLSILNFKSFIPATIISSQAEDIIKFIHKEKKVIIKPLDGMAGNGIFMVTPKDKNINVILETATNNGTKTIMAQRYLNEIEKGDKRIIVIKGEAIPFALARVPAKGEIRANLAKGGQGKAQKLTTGDKKIVMGVKDFLIKNKLNFVGLDVIGNYLTEINITSPTGIVEIEEQTNFKAAAYIINAFK
ncbi:glutathione synthase [Methylophilaceae bacterium]|jgi:glutathione synthase|nr:glutathione synthase [Methylophilaceae bacterium]